MSRSDKGRRQAAERALWRRSQSADAPIDEAARFLDLAGFAEGRLDADERERVAASLAGDPAAAEDVAAARTTPAAAGPEAGLDRIVARAVALVPPAAEAGGRVLVFARPARRQSILHGLAQWASLAAAVALVGWLGFAMGSDASLALSRPGHVETASEHGFLPDLLEPTNGFLPSLSEGSQT